MAIDLNIKATERVELKKKSRSSNEKGFNELLCDEIMRRLSVRLNLPLSEIKKTPRGVYVLSKINRYQNKQISVFLNENTLDFKVQRL